MRDHEKRAFGEAIAAAAELYGRQVGTPLVRLYWETLKHYELGDVTRALQQHMTDPDTGQFMPKPADVVRILEGSKETRSALAWTKVVQAIGRVGQYESVTFDDPLIHAVVQDMGGWIELCSMTDRDAPFRGQEFERRYRAYCVQPPGEYPPRLIGASEAHNGQHGFKVAPPVLIGDPSKAAAVLESGTGAGGLRITHQRVGAMVKRIASR